MSFDTGRFDLTGFDVTGGMLRTFKANGLESVTAVVGSALNYYLLAIGNERIEKSISGLQGLIIAGIGAESISEGAIEGLSCIRPRPIFTENISKSATLGAVIGVTVEFAENINHSVVMGADIAISAIFMESITPTIIPGADVITSADGYELVSADATSESVETKICVLNITLQPGQKLIIDASNYNVLLGGENAIWVQSGDWIDEINRNTTEIRIDAAAGSTNIDASIMYTERFL